MKIGVFGTGMVGDAIASKLVTLGHEVMMGSRDATNPKAVAWAKRSGANAHAGTFADTAAFGEVLFNCTHGASSLDVLRAAGATRLAGKVLVDIANILPPDKSVLVSLGEQIQEAFPETRVVKTLNTINCDLMVNPSEVSGSHTLFMSGNDAAAKATVRELVEGFGWKDVLDLGDIATARAVEAYLPLWLALWKKLGTAQFNIKVLR
jgi:predicted dinucleotide-binding enzyme